MSPEPLRRRLFRGARSTATLLLLELKVVTGSRLVVLAAIELAMFALLATWALLTDEPPDTASHYNRFVLLPTLLPAIALSMAAISGERDGSQLEVTFVTPGGRYQVWSFRLTAILASCGITALGLSLLTWAIVDRDFAPLAAAGHALFPLAAVVALTVFVSVLAKSGGVAGLVTAVSAGIGGVFFHEGRAKWYDLFFNPFDPPVDALDPTVWVRALFWNRTALLIVAGLLVTLTLFLLQRRERLL